MFSEQLNCFLSISRISDTAMFIGDLDQKLIKSYFKVPRGINAFDYRFVLTHINPRIRQTSVAVSTAAYP